MSPRKTRRGAKADGANETLSETISTIAKENSPVLGQRTMRTRGQLSKTISQDSDADQSLEMNKSKRRVVQEASSVRSNRSRRKALDEKVIDESSSALDVTTDTRKRTRRAKDKNDVSSNQTIPVDGSMVDEPRIEKSRSTRGRKRVAKRENTKSEEESAEIGSVERSDREVVVENVTIIGNDHVETTTNEIEAPMSKEDAEVQRVSTRNSRFRGSASTPSSPRSVVKRRARNTRARLEVCTPESSPITVNLSPHRTTKTPRKSPINLGGSPKSHADRSSLGLTKTPRKLPVVEESPSERSINSSINGTPERSLNQLNFTDGILDGSSSSSARKKKRAPKIKSPVDTPRKSPKDHSARKFSKSPKIVLRTPKAKSSKNKSPRIVTSKANKSPVPKRFTKSPVKSGESQSGPGGSSETSMIEKITSPTSPKRSKRSASPKKSVTTAGVATKSMDSRVTLNLSRIDSPSNVNEGRVSRGTSPTKGSRSTDAQKSPTVVLNKMSTPGDVEPEATTPTITRRSLSRRSNTSIGDSSIVTPVKTPSAEIRATQGCESPRRSKSAEKKRASIVDSGTPLRPTASPRIIGAPKSSIGKSVVNSAKKSTPVDGRLLMARGKIGNGENAPMLSSTPRERIRRSLNLSPGLAGIPLVANSPVNGSPVGSSTLVGEVRTTRSSRIEDVTNPLISEDDESFSLNEIQQNNEESRLNDTFQVAKKNTLSVEEEEAEEDKAVNGTYELIEPKTPTLRKRAAKRSLGETNTSIEEKTTKRICRVRFASPSLNSQDKSTLSGGTGRSRSATPGQRVGQKRFTPGISDVSIGGTANNSRRRSNSVTSVPLTKTPTVGVKRRSNSACDATSASKMAISASKTAQNESVNRLSKPRLYSHQPNKKSGLKTPLARKAPNFAQIHERKFAKMESLVDAKKRVESRHLAINSQIPQSSSRVNTAARSKPKVSPKRAAPSVPVNGAYNRYGFKLRKDDAVKMVSHKQPTYTRDKKRNENLLLIKGVRTNRRFDLIMKARNVNQ